MSPKISCCVFVACKDVTCGRGSGWPGPPKKLANLPVAQPKYAKYQHSPARALAYPRESQHDIFQVACQKTLWSSFGPSENVFPITLLVQCSIESVAKQIYLRASYPQLQLRAVDMFLFTKLSILDRYKVYRSTTFQLLIDIFNLKSSVSCK